MFTWRMSRLQAFFLPLWGEESQRSHWKMKDRTSDAAGRGKRSGRTLFRSISVFSEILEGEDDGGGHPVWMRLYLYVGFLQRRRHMRIPLSTKLMALHSFPFALVLLLGL